MRLHYFPESGNCYKVALMLALCEVPWEGVFVDYFNGETRRPQWRARVNEMGEAPVLEHGGERLTQSGVILQYLSEVTGKFAGVDAAGQREVMRWMFYDNHKVSSYFGTYRFLRSFSNGNPAVMQFLEGRINGCLGVLERRLETQPFIAGPAPTIADLSLAGYLFYPPDESGYDLISSHRNVGRWLARLAALPGWKAPYDLMPGQRFERPRGA